MSEFIGIELQTGERIVFGPVTSAKTSSFSGGAGPSQGTVSRTTGRTVGVTNQRVIIQDAQAPDKIQSIPAEQVQRVSIKHKKLGGQDTITIAQVRTAAGTTKVDLPGIDARQEGLLKETFANAEISTASGTSKGVLIAIGVVVAVAIICCLVTVGPLIIGRLAQ